MARPTEKMLGSFPSCHLLYLPLFCRSVWPGVIFLSLVEEKTRAGEVAAGSRERCQLMPTYISQTHLQWVCIRRLTP